MNVPLPQTFAGLSAKAALKMKTNALLQFPAFSWIGPERAFLHDVTAAILVFQSNKTAAMLVFPHQSCGSWTLFLCKHFPSEFVPINLHRWNLRMMSENALLQKTTRCQSLTGKNSKFTLVAVTFANWNYYCFRPSKNRKFPTGKSYGHDACTAN